jgi:tetratricopeptide (TPR) repeat protein
LGGRLERVQKSTLELLQLAAVIGRSFWLNLLAEAGSQDEETIQWAVEEALRFQLIEVSQVIDPLAETENQAVNIEYQFQHALIRETLYEELRPLRRRQLHRWVAAAMEALVNQGRLELAPAVMAFHFIAAAQEELAVPYLQQAGASASKVYANTEAVDYLSQAREILEDIALDLKGATKRANLVEQFELLSQERAILNLMSVPERELSALENLLNLAETLKDKKRWVEVMARLAAYYWQIGRLTQAEETARQALEVAQKNEDRPGQLLCLEQVARIFWTRRNGESMTFASEALVIARELGDRQREGRLTELIASIYTDTLHDVERATLYFRQALEICQETGNRYEEAWTLWGMGRLALLIDDYTGALEHYEQARKISEDIGSTLQIGWDLYHMGDAWYNLGDYGQALHTYQQAQTIFNSSHHVRGRIYALISLGLVYVATEQMDEGGRYLEQARQQAEERNDLILLSRGYEALGG